MVLAILTRCPGHIASHNSTIYTGVLECLEDQYVLLNAEPPSELPSAPASVTRSDMGLD